MREDKNNKMYKYYLPAILWAILIFIGSSIPSDSLPSFTIKMKDLILHFIEYTILGLLLALAVVQSPGRLSRKLFTMVLLIGILYGGSDEIHQKFVMGRHCTFSDFLADSAGVLMGLTVFAFMPSIARIFTSEK